MQLVSVVIPAYNSAQYLPDALRSCLAQTYQPIEIIVVDDGSTDNTRELVQDFPGVRYIYHENRGVAVARNTGLYASGGEYIQFLDADDTLAPTKIERCMRAFAEHPEVGWVYTDYVVFDPDMRAPAARQHPHPSGKMPEGDALWQALVQLNCFFPPHATLIARHALDAVGGSNEALWRSADWFMWLRLLAAGYRCYYIDEPLVQYRRTPNSLSSDILKRSYGNLLAAEALRDVPEIVARLNVDQLIALRHATLAMKLWQHGNRSEARQHWRMAIQLDTAKRGRRRLFMLWSYFMPAQAVTAVQSAFHKART